MHVKSNHGLEKSLNNYRLKYIHHLSYWKNTRQKNSWTIFENPKFGNIIIYLRRIFFFFHLIILI